MNKRNELLTDQVRNIFLIQLGDIGDVILSLPCIETLRENFCEANIVVAVRDKAVDLIEDSKWIQGVLSIDKKKRPFFEAMAYQKNFFSKMRSFHFDLAIDLRTGTRGAFLAYFSGARRRVGFFAEDEKVWRNWLFTDLMFPVELPKKNISYYYLSLLTSLGMKPVETRPRLDVSEQKKQQAANLLRDCSVPLKPPIVVVHPFSLWRYKEWGIDKYIKLIKWITAEDRATVVVLGSPGERERAENIVAACKKSTFNIAGKTSLGVLAGVLSHCSFFVGGDSAGMHLSAAIDLPTLTIFGPTAPESWAPEGENHRIVQKKLKCVPCKEKGCHGRGESRCLNELTVEEVVIALKSHPGWVSLFGFKDLTVTGPD